MTKIRTAARGESGFTLVELLVVMLIIGLLAAIAIPAFFNQRNKANDASAKESVRTVQTALETYSTDNNGSYTGATAANLKTIEGAVPPACATPVTVAPCISALTVTTDTYTITVTAKTTLNNYTIRRLATGTIEYPCTLKAGGTDRGGCPTSGFWN